MENRSELVAIIQRAPEKALIIWPTYLEGQLLAKSMGRKDLTVKPVEWLRPANTTRHYFPKVCLPRGWELTIEQTSVCELLTQTVEQRKNHIVCCEGD